MNKSLKKRLPKIIIILSYAIFYLVSYLSGVECIWKWIFGVPCPGCGFTHAVIFALKLDFTTAFSYHPMFWSFPIIIYWFVFSDELKNKWNDYMMIGVLFGFLICWVYRLTNCAIP